MVYIKLKTVYIKQIVGSVRLNCTTGYPTLTFPVIALPTAGMSTSFHRLTKGEP